MMTRARVSAAGILTVLVASVGCTSGNPDAPCRVQGKVTYNNAPVTGGFVLFHQSDGTTTSLPVFADGSYSGDLKEGTFTVTVDTESLNPNKKEDNRPSGAGKAYGAAGGGSGGGGSSSKYKAQQASPTPESAGPKPEYVKIPSKYASAATSNLSITTKRGKNEYNIPLTD